MFLTEGLWRLLDLARQTWVRVALFCVLALAIAALSPLIAPLLPDDLQDRLGRDPTLELLSILTSSMLVVATFSLSVMVSAHHFAASQATPRAHRLLREDGRTQQVLATFIGAFVFALTSRIAVNAEVYDLGDYPVIYGVTVLVMIAVVLALINWVQQLSALGSIEKTTGRVQQATAEAISALARAPYLGCAPLPPDAPPLGRSVTAGRTGYVRYIDVEGLSGCIEDGGRIDVPVLPGDWVGSGDPILLTEGVTADDDDLREKIVLGDLRSFDQDPIFGLQVMSEIGQRALSPGINDPQTAVDVVRRQARLLSDWNSRVVEASRPGLRLRETSALRAVQAAIDPIARDGAHLLEVQLAVQEALARLSGYEDADVRQAALAISARALKRSDAALELEDDRDAVRAAAPSGKDHSAA